MIKNHFFTNQPLEKVEPKNLTFGYDFAPPRDPSLYFQLLQHSKIIHHAVLKPDELSTPSEC